MAEEKSVSKDTAPAEPRPAPAPPAKNETFVPLIFGGAVACALGFFGAQIEAVEQRLGLGGDSELAALVQEQSDALDAQAAQIAELTLRLSAAEEIEIPEVDLSGITSELDAQANVLANQTDATTALAARIQDLEKRPMTEGLSEDAIAAYETELSRLQASVAEQRSEIEGLIEEARLSETMAAEQARMANARAAATRVVTAINNGAPFAAELAEVEALGAAAVPEPLSAAAEDGVPTLAALRDAFPESARAALAATRADSNGGNVVGFLQKQLGVRSVAPREGSDPDAVLSRAEAAVRDGQIDAALTELSALPDPARDAMAGWITQAEIRSAVVAAADELLSALATN